MKKYREFILPAVIVLIGLLWCVMMAQAVDFTLMSDVTDMTLSAYVGDVSRFWIWTLSWESSILGELVDDGSPTYYDDSAWAIQTRIKLLVDSTGTPAHNDVAAGTYTIVSFNSGTAYIYVPFIGKGTAGSFWLANKWVSPDSYYYVSTYNDAACTDLAYSAIGSPTPTSTPSVTPTPSTTPTTTPSVTPTAVPTAQPTAQETPTVTPVYTPTATPFCNPGDGYYAWDITNVVLSQTRSATIDGMQYNFVIASDLTSSSGHIYDYRNVWVDGTEPNYGIVAIKISGSAIEVHAGDSVQITSGGETLFVFFPNVAVATTLYVGINGSTYYDASLCDLAFSSVDVKTPTPTPVPTATPFQADCLSLVSYPLTAEETSIYALYNADMGAILDYANNYCFRSPVGWGDIGVNAVGNDQLRDNSVTNTEILDNTITTDEIAGHTLTSFNVNTTQNFFDSWDVFPTGFMYRFPYMSAWDTPEPKWQIECIPEWDGSTDTEGGFKISWHEANDDGVDTWVGTAMFIDPSNHWMSIGGNIPSAQLDVNGPARIRGPLTIDEGMVQQWKTIADGDTTPRVFGTRYLTDNTSTTKITDFDDAQSGHEFVLWVTDTNTTWNAMTGTINFTNWTATTIPIDVLFRFLRRGDRWYETGVYDYSVAALPGIPDPSEIYAFDGFENGMSAGDGDWSGPWTGSNPAKIDTDVAHIGSYAAQLGRGGSMYRGITTTSGSATITLWYYVASGSPNLTVYDSINATTWVELTNATLSGGWSQWDIPWTTNASYSTEYLKFVNDSTTSSYVWLDDITIE